MDLGSLTPESKRVSGACHEVRTRTAFATLGGWTFVTPQPRETVTDIDWLTRDLPADARDRVRTAANLADAWRGCERAEHLIALALSAGLGRALVVRAVAELVGDAMAAHARGLAEQDAAPVRDLRVHRALVTALDWVGGRADAKEAWAAGFAAAEAASAMNDPLREAGARAASCLAFACDEEADEAFYAHRGYLVQAVEHAHVLLGDAAAAAARVRAEIPLATFLEAVDRRTRMRSEIPPVDPEAEATDSFYC